MSLLFDVPTNKRVRIMSKSIRWVERGRERQVAENVVFEATTTDRYFTYQGKRRRLVVDHTLESHLAYGVWQLDVECEEL